jgi:hypothetical protein
MIAQADLAAYWQAPTRHGFVRPKWDVRIAQFDRAGRVARSWTMYVCAWTQDEARQIALRVARDYESGRLSAVSVEYSQPVTWG